MRRRPIRLAERKGSSLHGPDHDLAASGGAPVSAGRQPAGPVAAAGTEADSSSEAAPRSARRGTPAWSGWKPAAVFTAAATLLFCCFLRLSATSAVNSDSANVLLMGWDLLHGNLLLQGWHTADVSLYTTELPQYALLESFLGLHPETAHVAAAMTYTLAVLLAVLLARGGTSGRAALTRTLIAAGIMVAPQLGVDAYTLTMVVDHIGTSVPLMVLWLLLDRIDRSNRAWPGGRIPPDSPAGARPRTMPSPGPPARWWWVPVLATLILAWVLIADPIVLIVGIAPLALVGGLRFVQGVLTGDGCVSPGWIRRVRAQWYPLALACAAVAAIIWARLAEWLLGGLGAFVVHAVPVAFTPWQQWRLDYPPALWKVLELFGADYRGLAGAQFAVAVLHLASVALVGWSMLWVAWRFFGGIPLVDQVLAVAILFNVILYLGTDASTQGPHEIAIVMPFGAALAARVVAGPSYRPGKRRPAASTAASGRRLTGYIAGSLILAGYLAGLGYELTQPAVPPENSALTSWLAAHHLTYGLAGYWQASSVTVSSDGRVAVRALTDQSMKPYLWLAKTSWYDPALHRATFIVIDTQARFANALPPAAIKRYFGAPVRTYRTGPYIIMVWAKNLLPSMPP
jgi:hypothetical protein